MTTQEKVLGAEFHNRTFITMKPLDKLGVINSAIALKDKCKHNCDTPGGIRTHDLRIRNPLLYPTELQAYNALLNQTSSLVPYWSTFILTKIAFHGFTQVPLIEVGIAHRGYDPFMTH